MKILVIEDEEIMVKTIKEKLLSEGFDVHVAVNGLQGLELAKSIHPDLILLDLVLPVLDGLTFLKRLRNDEWGEYAKVIVLSNLSDPTELTKGVDIGLNSIAEYMVKTDWSLDDMVVEVKKTLEMK